MYSIVLLLDTSKMEDLYYDLKYVTQLKTNIYNYVIN